MCASLADMSPINLKSTFMLTVLYGIVHGGVFKKNNRIDLLPSVPRIASYVDVIIPSIQKYTYTL